MITMRKSLPKKSHSKNYFYLTVEFYIYGYKQPTVVFNKFKSLISVPSTAKSNTITIKAKNKKDLGVLETTLYREWTQFKSLCCHLRSTTIKTKNKCICNDLTKCILLTCDCPCHNEHKFFFSRSWILTDFDKLLLAIEHLGHQNPVTQNLKKSNKLSEISKINICLSCQAKYKNLKCSECELTPTPLSMTKAE